jgi:alpha-ketoglutarate-dependent taurine dioxygenase
MLKGQYQSTDTHVNKFRQHLLIEQQLDLPRAEVLMPENIQDFANLQLKQYLKENHFCLIKLKKLLTNEEFLAFGTVLGTPIKEFASDKVVAPYIENEVILNIISNNAVKDNPSSQPFTSRYLTLHTECSRRKAEDQPKYLVFMCCNSGHHSEAKTIMIPREKVLKALKPEEIAILKHTHYAQDTPSLIREENDHLIFSFRDFYPEAMNWVYKGKEEKTEEEINEAITSLLLKMYDPQNANGIAWEKGLIMVLDNRYFFHGKQKSNQIELTNTRHIKRLRII